MAWLQGSAVGHAMRETGVWTYGVVNLVHILGVASLFGALLVLDLRLLGVWRKVALPAISEPTVSVATVGFFVAAISGVCLLATKATEYVDNPFLYIKFPAIGLGLLNVAILQVFAVPGSSIRRGSFLCVNSRSWRCLAGYRCSAGLRRSLPAG